MADAKALLQPSEPVTSFRPIAEFPVDLTPPMFSNATSAVSQGTSVLIQFGYYDPNEIINRINSAQTNLLPVSESKVETRSLARFAVTREQAVLMVQQLTQAVAVIDNILQTIEFHQEEMKL